MAISTIAWNLSLTSNVGIKIILLIALMIGVVVISRSQKAGQMALRRSLTFLFALGAGLAIVFPTAFSTLARFLGVGRGSDLLLYCLVVAFFASLIAQWRHNVALQAQITQLARSLAILEAQDQSQPQPQPPHNQPPQ